MEDHYILSRIFEHLRGHQTEFNQTLPHVWKWDGFENSRSKFGGPSPWNIAPQNCLFWVILQQCLDLSMNVFHTKHSVDTQNIQWTFLYFILKFGELWAHKHLTLTACMVCDMKGRRQVATDPHCYTVCLVNISLCSWKWRTTSAENPFLLLVFVSGALEFLI